MLFDLVEAVADGGGKRIEVVAGDTVGDDDGGEEGEDALVRKGCVIPIPLCGVER